MNSLQMQVCECQNKYIAVYTEGEEHGRLLVAVEHAARTRRGQWGHGPRFVALELEKEVTANGLGARSLVVPSPLAKKHCKMIWNYSLC